MLIDCIDHEGLIPVKRRRWTRLILILLLLATTIRTHKVHDANLTILTVTIFIIIQIALKVFLALHSHDLVKAGCLALDRLKAP